MDYYWVRASSSDFTGTLPQRRSGHTAVIVNRSIIVFFGGFVDKEFISNLVVYDTERKAWFEPKCIGNGHEEGEVGPSPRAFHAAVSIDFHMFVFGGRSGAKRLGDFWVLDTEIWQWTELCGFGDLPSPRDFSAAVSAGNEKIIIFGGWDGKKWLSDVYVLDTVSLEWAELFVSGSLPPPRCGHTATMLEKRLLVYGGRGGGGPIMGDLWALKGLIREEGEAAGWTQLRLGGQHPSPRCGHTLTSGGRHLLLFGGHGTGGWLSRYDVYHNHCVVLDRVSAQWKRLAVGNEAPPPRAYHSMTCVGSRFLLFGGFDGKTTYDDVWWLVSEGDAIARGVSAVSPSVDGSTASAAVMQLRQHQRQADDDDDGDFLDVANSLLRGEASGSLHAHTAVQFLRQRWIESAPRSLSLKELAPLLRDYRRLIAQKHHAKVGADPCGDVVYRFYHVRSAEQLRMDDIPFLLREYKLLLSENIF